MFFIMSDIYLVPKLKKGQFHRAEIIVKKSRFITSIGHTNSTESAKAFIESISNEFSDARHNCFAFNATAPNSTAYCGCSDDGEPHGTAGHPMLNVLLHCGVGEITCVVTRYFGGILLGTGGLVKAYQDSVKEGLLNLETTTRMIEGYVDITIEHRHITLLQRLYEKYRVSTLKQNFSDKANYILVLPKNNIENFVAELNEITKGSLQYKILENV